jgi:hypothetical protein
LENGLLQDYQLVIVDTSAAAAAAAVIGKSVLIDEQITA